MTNIVANGNAYSDDGSSSRDMQGGGFRQWLLPMLRDTMQQTGQDASALMLASQAVPLTLTNQPTIRPSLLLDFTNSRSVDPRITFTRASTATRTNEKGLIETVAANVPRIDFDPLTGECRGLLIEEPRTNLLLNSAGDSAAGWNKGPNQTKVGNVAAPDGSLNATTYSATAVGNAYIGQNINLAANTPYTISVFARLRSGSAPTTGNLFALDIDTDGNGDTFERAGLPFAGLVLDSKWRRYSLTVQNVAARIGASAYICTDINVGVEIDIWGVQLEAGAFPTSYIPTTTTAVTRAADVAYIAQGKLSDFMNPSAGTLAVEYSLAGFSKTSIAEQRAATIGFGAGGAIKVRSYSTANANYDSDATTAVGGYAYDPSGVVNTAVNIKIKSAITYGGSGLTFATAGVAKENNSNPFYTPPYDVLALGSFENIGFLNGHLQRVVYYPSEMGGAALEAITAL